MRRRTALKRSCDRSVDSQTGYLPHACRALCRARVAEELQRRRGTRIGEQLKLVLSIIDRRQER